LTPCKDLYASAPLYLLSNNSPPELYLSEINNGQVTAGKAILLSFIKCLYFSDKAQGIALRINTIQSKSTRLACG